MLWRRRAAKERQEELEEENYMLEKTVGVEGSIEAQTMLMIMIIHNVV